MTRALYDRRRPKPPRAADSSEGRPDRASPDRSAEHGGERPSDTRPRFNDHRPDRKGPPRHGAPRQGQYQSRPKPGDGEDAPIRLYGLHAVEAALANDRRVINRLLMTENAENKLAAVIGKRGVTAERTTPRELDRLLGADTVHQGVMLETELLDEPELIDIAETAAGGGGPVLVLDQVTDPHNVGAVLRSAAVFGASGVVMHRRHSPPLNGTLAKSASGALELVPVVMAQNLSRTLEDLKEQGFTILALDSEAETLLEDEPLTGAIALVLGSEGKGLRQLTKEHSHKLVKVATGGAIDSLNVSNAAAIALHLAAMRRRGK